MIMSYHIRSSCCVCGSFCWYFSASVRIVFVSFTGIFKYRFVMSRDASVKCGAIGVSCNLWSRFVVFFTLKVFGSGAILFIFCVNGLDSWYAGA